MRLISVARSLFDWERMSALEVAGVPLLVFILMTDHTLTFADGWRALALL